MDNLAPLLEDRQRFLDDVRLYWSDKKNTWAIGEVKRDQWSSASWLQESHTFDPWSLFRLVQENGGWSALDDYAANDQSWRGFAGSLGIQATARHRIGLRLFVMYRTLVWPVEQRLREGLPAAPPAPSGPSAPSAPAPSAAPAPAAPSGPGPSAPPPSSASVPGSASVAAPSVAAAASSAPVASAPAAGGSSVEADQGDSDDEDGATMSQPQPPGQGVIVVDTPSNRRGKFSREDASTYPENIEPKLASMVPEPKPRIYRHCVLGLRCGIPEEVDFALGHLVVMSDERGDKFLLMEHGDLAEDLIDVILRVSRLTHGVAWEVGYDFTSADAKSPSVEVLNGAFGTRDILERLGKLKYCFPQHELEDKEFLAEMRRVGDAAHTLRNLVMEEKNAKWLEDIETMRDCAAIVLSLPNDDRFDELKADVLDIVEQCSPFWDPWENDPLLTVLPNYFVSDDRGMILTALSAVVQFATKTDWRQKPLHLVPWGKVNHLFNLTLLDNDPELLFAILDFFYQYTTKPQSIDMLRMHLHLPTTIIKRTTRLLVYEAEVLQETYVDRPAHRAPPPKTIPEPPPTLYAALMQYPEPNRTAAWLRCCFVEDAECEITQLALWQAYQHLFAEGKYGFQSMPTLQATDFIATITNTFPHAQGAKILDGTSAKYILKGIRPLETVYDLRGFPYYFCKWGHDSSDQIPCDYVDQNATAFGNHVLQEHLKLVATAQGWARTKPSNEPTTCLWEGCTDSRHANVDFNTLANHVVTHLPTPPADPNIPPPKPERPMVPAGPSRVFEFYDTPVDEKEGLPTGIAYRALLVLRNIQRGLPNAKAGSRYKHRTWTTAMFGSIRTELLEIAAHNRTLAEEIFALVSDIDKYSVVVPEDQDNRW